MRGVPEVLLLQQLVLQRNDISPRLETALARRAQPLEQKWDAAEGRVPSFSLVINYWP